MDQRILWAEMGDKWTEDAGGTRWGRNWDKNAPNIEIDTKGRERLVSKMPQTLKQTQGEREAPAFWGGGSILKLARTQPWWKPRGRVGPKKMLS